MESATILVCAPDDTSLDAVAESLGAAGWQVQRLLLGSPDPTDVERFAAVIVVGGQRSELAIPVCRSLRARPGEGVSLQQAGGTAHRRSYVPVIFVGRDSDPAIRVSALAAGADACLLSPVDGELPAQVQALVRVKYEHDRMREQSEEASRMNRQLEAFHERMTQELELARRIQHGLLPPQPPELPRTRFAVEYRPCGRVGGDFYDVFRLDENHVGFYVADAMGRGVPASLLTMFLKKGVRAKDIFENQYRLVAPDEVLQRLNRDLLEQGLADHPFITMVYALYNFRTGLLQFSRAGHPHPLLVPQSGELETLQITGSLLGVFETRFSSLAKQLRAGDKVLFYTDGIEGVSYEGKPPGTPSLLACAARHRRLPVSEFVERLTADLLSVAKQADDFTLVGLEVVDDAG